MIWPDTGLEVIRDEPLLEFRIPAVKDCFIPEKNDQVSHAQVVIKFGLPAEQILVRWLRDPTDDIPSTLIFSFRFGQWGAVCGSRVPCS